MFDITFSNQILFIAAKNYGEADINVFRSFPILLDLFTTYPMLTCELSASVIEKPDRKKPLERPRLYFQGLFKVIKKILITTARFSLTIFILDILIFNCVKVYGSYCAVMAKKNEVMFS